MNGGGTESAARRLGPVAQQACNTGRRREIEMEQLETAKKVAGKAELVDFVVVKDITA